jgi:hypothetical protein
MRKHYPTGESHSGLTPYLSLSVEAFHYIRAMKEKLDKNIDEEYGLRVYPGAERLSALAMSTTQHRYSTNLSLCCASRRACYYTQ